MKDKKYIDFEVWKKINKNKPINIKTKPVDETIESVKKSLFCKNINLKNDKNV